MTTPQVNKLAFLGAVDDPNLFWVHQNELRAYGDTPDQAITSYCLQEGYIQSGKIIFDDAVYFVIRPKS